MLTDRESYRRYLVVRCEQIDRSQSLYYPVGLVIMLDRQQLAIDYTLALDRLLKDSRIVAKIGFTALSLGAGFQGGEVTPLFQIPSSPCT